jgi:hypothetical protein
MAALRDLATEAFLVGLAPADGDKQALGRLLEVLDIQRNEFGPSERTGEAKQQNGAVAQATKRLRVCSHRDDDVGGRRLLANRSGADGSPDTRQDGLDPPSYDTSIRATSDSTRFTKNSSSSMRQCKSTWVGHRAKTRL